MLKGEYVPEETEAFLFGKLMHAWNEDCFDEFVAQNPKLLSSRGKTKDLLKSEYQNVFSMIEALENDPNIMKSLAGEKEVIFTA